MESIESLRCVVLGGGGFIGTNLCRRLLGRVAYVRAFGRRQSFPAALTGIDWFSGDFNDSSAVAGAIKGCDTVFHLISSSTPASSNVDKVADVHANVIGSLRLLEACLAERVRRVIFVSSGGAVYGIPDQIPTPEHAQTWPITGYGISKVAVERYLRLFEYLHNLDYRVLRVANPFGPYQLASKGQGVIAAFLEKVLAGKPVELWGDGTISRDFIYIDDVTDALELAALHEGVDRVFNIGSGVAHSLNEIIEVIALITGRKIAVERRKGRPIDAPVTVLDISRVRNSFGWTPRVSLDDGLSYTVEWMRAVGQSVKS